MDNRTWQAHLELEQLSWKANNSVSVYKAVFGTEYHLQTTCSVEEAQLYKTIEELKEVIDDDGHQDRYLNRMKGDHNDEVMFDNALGDTDTALIKKGVSYWDNKSYSDSEADRERITEIFKYIL